MKSLEGQRALVTGGTGSLGLSLCERILACNVGDLVVLSRDEAKQDAIRQQQPWGRDPRLRFVLGDVRDPKTMEQVVDGAAVVVNAAALKQVPACEYAPWEAVRTNVEGAENLVAAAVRVRRPPKVIVGVSTDKACKPVNAMGMSKALQERILIQGNLRVDPAATRIVCVRYGNVLASRGSVIPLFHRQVATGGPVTVTSAEMTRFLLSMDRAVDTIVHAIERGFAGDIWIPRVPSARIVHVAEAIAGNRAVEIREIGPRPGEKVHEILVSEEESRRCRVALDGWYAIGPGLPELEREGSFLGIQGEYSSKDVLLSSKETAALLRDHELLGPNQDEGDTQ